MGINFSDFEYFIVCMGLTLVTENVSVDQEIFKAIDIYI
jgi:hypothetical protein